MTSTRRPAPEGLQPVAGMPLPAGGLGLALLSAYMQCPGCGSQRLRVVTDGQLTNLLCLGCRRCWHPKRGFMVPVDPASCPGCSSASLCGQASTSG